MAIRLPMPPQLNDFSSEEKQWRESLWRYARGTVSTSGDVSFEISSASTYHGVTALTAGRNLTLPPASTMQDGDEIVIQDESGQAGTHTITIITQGTDTISGTATITANYGRRRVIKRGSGKYFCA